MGDQLLMYGMYEHIVHGDAPDTLPSSSSWNIVANQAKHRAYALHACTDDRYGARHFGSVITVLGGMRTSRAPPRNR
jgi:hypothetical protein